MTRALETKPRNRIYVRKFDWDEARKLRAEGWTYPALSEHFEVSIQAVRRVCNEKQYQSERARVRERQKQGSCPECGNPMSFNYSRRSSCCVRCSAEKRADVTDRVAKCVLCQEWQPHENFLLQPGKHRGRRGLRPNCRTCDSRLRREHRAANSEHELLKSRAYHALRRAIKRGEIIKPGECENCGSDNKIQAHHEDHHRPLDVVWLCDTCHRGHHHGSVVLSFL